MRGIYEATEVTTPTTFIIVRERLKSEDDEAAGLSRYMKDDGTGLAAEGEHVDRLKECSTWLNLGARFARGVAKCSPTAICDAVAEACDELVVGEEVFLYLIEPGPSQVFVSPAAVSFSRSEKRNDLNQPGGGI